MTFLGIIVLVLGVIGLGGMLVKGWKAGMKSNKFD